MLNAIIWLCGLLALSYLALAWILPAEVRSIRKELETDQDVEAYFFHWYEGQTLATQVWLRGGGFYNLNYIGIEAFADVGFGERGARRRVWPVVGQIRAVRQRLAAHRGL